MQHRSGIALFIVLMISFPQAIALDLEQFAKGTSKFNFRYRYEDVDQQGMREDAGASTLRSRFTWSSGLVDKFQIGLEADYVSVIGAESYNSTENGKGQYPVVPDPEGFDLNRAYLRYVGDNTTVDLGRQRILHGGQRFVGGVGWRQNEQTYDALRIQPRAGQWSLDYAFVWNVNRIFGPDDGAQPADWQGNSHLFLASRPLGEGHKIQTFGYWLDFENDNGPANSSSTWGIGYEGRFGPAKLSATIATQSDYADSPFDYSAEFYALQADFSVSPLMLTLGYELLGSDDGTQAFQTPLATLHKFQGWNDKFLVSPSTGLRDLYVGVKGKVSQVTWNLMWHDFGADEGGADYGDEVNLVLGYAFNSAVKLQLKASKYNADEFATDTAKLWLTTTVSF